MSKLKAKFTGKEKREKELERKATATEDDACMIVGGPDFVTVSAEKRFTLKKESMAERGEF